MIFGNIKTVDLSLHSLLFLLPKSNRLNDHCLWGRHTAGEKAGLSVFGSWKPQEKICWQRSVPKGEQSSWSVEKFPLGQEKRLKVLTADLCGLSHGTVRRLRDVAEIATGRGRGDRGRGHWAGATGWGR